MGLHTGQYHVMANTNKCFQTIPRAGEHASYHAPNSVVASSCSRCMIPWQDIIATASIILV